MLFLLNYFAHVLSVCMLLYAYMHNLSYSVCPSHTDKSKLIKKYVFLHSLSMCVHVQCMCVHACVQTCTSLSVHVSLSV